MKLKLDRPLAFLDIESTGANWRVDRLIDLAVIKLMPDGTRESLVFRVNPQIPIPRATTMIHGIRDEDVKDSPSFADTADAIAHTLEGCDLGGYNLLRFDIPLLEEEFKRVGKPLSFADRRVIDAQRIYHQREPRDLTAALAFYCGQVHAGAHGALADTEATIRVLEGQFEKYTDLPADVAILSEYCHPTKRDYVDRDGRLMYDTDGEIIVNFGKYRGKKLRDLAVSERHYLEWMTRKDFAPEVVEPVRLALEGHAPVRPATGLPPAAEE